MGSNPRGRSSPSQQFALGVDNTTITFECGHCKHTYKINFGTKPLHRRMGPQGCRLMARWWSRDRGGCLGQCPKCERSANA